MNSKTINLKFSILTNYKISLMKDLKLEFGEFVFPDPSKDIMTTPTSSINKSDIIDMPNQMLKRKY